MRTYGLAGLLAQFGQQVPGQAPLQRAVELGGQRHRPFGGGAGSGQITTSGERPGQLALGGGLGVRPVQLARQLDRLGRRARRQRRVMVLTGLIL